MKKFGLIGKKLSYSFSPIIHNFLLEKFNIDGTYNLIEVDEITDEVLKSYDGVNITIPFKESVHPYLSNTHTKMSAINTVFKTEKGLDGFNTDIEGFIYLISKLGFDMETCTFAILGNGATSHMIQTYFGSQVKAVVSRRGDTAYDYTMLDMLDADILVNTTPIGMNEFKSPVEKKNIKQFKGVIDLNYNPINSKLGLDCLASEIPFVGGLYMLIVQAIRAFEIWNDVQINDEIIDEIYAILLQKVTDKIAIIGMPLSGKTTVVQKHNGFDVDIEVEKRSGKTIPTLLREETFREIETETIAALVEENKKLISLGGGAVLKMENIALLQDYTIVFLDTPPEELKKRWEPNARPLLRTLDDIDTTYAARYALYKDRSNIAMDVDILEKWVKEI